MPEKTSTKPASRPLQIALAATLAISGIVIGVAATWGNGKEHFQQGATPASGQEDNQPPSLQQRVQQLESTVEQTLKIQGQLLELVNELNSKLHPEGNNEEIRHAAAKIAPSIEEQREQHRANRVTDRFQRQREHQIRNLTEAGFSHARATEIVERQERIYYEQMQLSYEYTFLRDKATQEARALQEKIHTYSNPRRVMEQELSSGEFEQYMEAFGGRSEFHIGDLLEDAPAYQAGLRPGDKIIRYNNQRVFHMGDLRSQVYQVAPGENVAVEVQRQGSSSTETIYIPSGPLGIRG